MLWLVQVTLLFWHVNCSSGKCLYLRDERTIRCQNTSLEDVGESLHVLTKIVPNRPHTVELEDCHSVDGRLPADIFQPLSSVEAVRVRRCGVLEVDIETFVPLRDSLVELDLSHNTLSEVPAALSKIKSLKMLRLQHNMIRELRPDSILLPDLMLLDLAHNSIGLAVDGARNGYTLKGSIPFSEFTVSQTLESLNLRANRLAVLPDQLLQARLIRNLDLSENVLEGLPSAFQHELETLDLHSNRIQGINRDFIPVSTLKYLDLTDNPFHCDCEVRWLNDNFSRDATVHLPLCHSPEPVKGLRVDQVSWTEECNATIDHTKDTDVLQLESVSPTRLTVEWKSMARGEWKVLYRRETDPPHKMTLVQPPTPHRHLTISGLDPSTRYVVCVARVHDTKYTIQPGKCSGVTTLSVGAAAIHTQLEKIVPKVTDVTVRWTLGADHLTAENSYRHEWTIRLRRTGTGTYTEIPVYDITTAEDTDGQRYEYTITDLKPRTHYEVCLVTVEHIAIGTATDVRLTSNETCVTAETSGAESQWYGSEVAAVVMACLLCVVVSGATLVLCRRKGILRKVSPTPPPSPVAQPPPPPTDEKKALTRSYVGNWNSLRIPNTDHRQPEFRSFRTVSYRDALTSVTIYKSGFSEC